MPTKAQTRNKGKAPKKTPKVKLTESEIFDLAKEVKAEKATEAAAKGRWKDLQDNKIIPALDALKVTSIGRPGIQVTRVQAESVTYDPAGLRREKKISSRIRRRIFRRSLVLSDLAPEVELAVVNLLKENGVKSTVVQWALDVDALSSEVQAGNIDPDAVKPHATVNKNAPYLTISLGQD